MTDPFTPTELRLVNAEAPLARATCEPVRDFLHGPALRMLLAERIEQIEKHGYLPDADLAYDGAELALAAKSYLDSYIDLELRPDTVRQADDYPESWPFQHDFWREPGYEDRARALTKALALGLAELDRLLSAMAMLHAARPLAAVDHSCRVCGAQNLMRSAGMIGEMIRDDVVPWPTPNLCTKHAGEAWHG